MQVNTGGEVIKNKAAANAQPATVAKYMTAVVLPRTFQMVVKVAALVAGPVIRKTSAAPGLIPFNIRAAAIAESRIIISGDFMKNVDFRYGPVF